MLMEDCCLTILDGGIQMYPMIPVVLTHNRPNLLKRCLESLEVQPQIEEICIVDNASSEDTLRLLREKKIIKGNIPKEQSCYMYIEKNKVDSKRYTYIRLSNNIGSAAFSKALSFLITESEYDYFYLLDDDAYVGKDCFREWNKYFYQDDAIASLKVSEEDNEIMIGHLGFVDKNRFFPVKNLDTEVDFPEYVTFSSNVGFAISRNLINSIGFQREDFFIRGDDCEYCFRMSERGKKIRLLPSSIIYHPTKKEEILAVFLIDIRNLLEISRLYTNTSDEEIELLVEKLVESFSKFSSSLNIEELKSALKKVNLTSTSYLLNFPLARRKIKKFFSSKDDIRLPDYGESFLCLGSSSFTKKLLNRKGCKGGIYIEKRTPYCSYSLLDVMEGKVGEDCLILCQFHPVYIFKAVQLMVYNKSFVSKIIFPELELQ